MKNKNAKRVFDYILLILVATAAGILSRDYKEILPDVVARYAGDVMWAFALYFLVSIFLVKKSFGIRFSITCLLALLDEVSQIYHAPWIDKIRETTLGGFALGFTFVWTDLLCYLGGALLALLIDYLAVKT
jgi:hypothetical protein